MTLAGITVRCDRVGHLRRVTHEYDADAAMAVASGCVKPNVQMLRHRHSIPSGPGMPSPATEQQCKRCQKWKPFACFHLDAAQEESRHICRDCFAAWLDEQWALDQQQPRQV